MRMSAVYFLLGWSLKLLSKDETAKGKDLHWWLKDTLRGHFERFP